MIIGNILKYVMFLPNPFISSLMNILNSQMVTSTHMMLLTRKKERTKGKQEGMVAGILVCNVSF